MNLRVSSPDYQNNENSTRKASEIFTNNTSNTRAPLREPLASRAIEENFASPNDRKQQKNNNPLNFHPDKENIDSFCMLRTVKDYADSNNYIIGNLVQKYSNPFTNNSHSTNFPYYSNSYENSLGVV